MIDEKEMQKFVKWIHSEEYAFDIPDNYADREFWQIVDNDRSGLEKILDDMPLEYLEDMSGFFEDIYQKWPDKKMIRFLDCMSRKLTNAGYETSWFG